MSRELKYPVKYAILELKEQGGWLVGYENITQGFIVSKCYVVGTNIKYYSNGENEIIHKVVFPFKNISDFRVSLQRGSSYNSDETIPSYDACGNPYPVDVVLSLFDSYEEAKKIAVQKNEEMRSKLISNVSLSEQNWKEKYEKLKIDFLENLSICHKYEELILMLTENMNISDSQIEISCKKLQKVNFK